MSQRVWTCTHCGWRATAENVEHFASEHVMGEPPNDCGDDGCACDQFSAVAFHVERA